MFRCACIIANLPCATTANETVFRYLSSQCRRLVLPPQPRDWQALSVQQREAWKLLGWCKSSFQSDSCAPSSSSRPWRELSATEQAAATHGLGYTPEQWDRAVAKAVAPAANRNASLEEKVSVRDGHPSKQSGQSSNGAWTQAFTAAACHVKSAPATSFGSALAGAAIHVVSVAASQAGLSVPAISKDAEKIAAKSLAERMVGDVRVNRIENAVYIDDSDSMNDDHLFEAHRALARMAKTLGTAPTRIVKFGSAPHVITARCEAGKGEEAVKAAIKKWNGSSGGTYMWKMIEHDIFQKYIPGSGRLRVFIVTDGMDELSPWAYRGVHGMNPMMKCLQGAGFDIEFYIVIVGAMTKMSGIKEYKDLAGSTGGAFLSIETKFDELAPDAKYFVSAILKSSSGEDDASSGRQERRRKHAAEQLRLK